MPPERLEVVLPFPQKLGSEHNDSFEKRQTLLTILWHTGRCISNGMDIYFKKLLLEATIMKKQHTINQKGESIQLQVEGRHDPVVPRVASSVEAMAVMVLADFYLLNKSTRLKDEKEDCIENGH